MVATKLQRWKNEDSERWLRGERDQIKLIDLRFKRWQVARFRKIRRQDVPYIACSWDDVDVLDRGRGVGREISKGCE